MNHADFYENPAIQSMAGDPLWTLTTNDKMPVSAMDLYLSGAVVGCRPDEWGATVTLWQLAAMFPAAANASYLLDCDRCGWCVLDIEPKCPSEISERLLRLPYAYGEVSMSGRGYHLVLPAPKTERADTLAKVALKEPHGYYEVLQHHWVNFTRQTLPPATGAESFAELWEELAGPALDLGAAGPAGPVGEPLGGNAAPAGARAGAGAKGEARRKASPTEAAPAGRLRITPAADKGVVQALRDMPWRKSADGDYLGDNSRHEYAYLARLRDHLAAVMGSFASWLTDEQVAWLISEAAATSGRIPERKKWSETRRGVPWLRFQAEQLVRRAGHLSATSRPLSQERASEIEEMMREARGAGDEGKG